MPAPIPLDPLPARLAAIVRASAPTMAMLRAVRDAAPPAACVGAGAIRSLVWDHLHGRATLTPVDDVDVVYHDPRADEPATERATEVALSRRLPGLRWEAVNQAFVHCWLAPEGGSAPAPNASLEAGIAGWPEVATCIGVRLADGDRIEVVAPHGLADLFAMIVRRNAARVDRDTYLARVHAKRFDQRWPRVRVLPC